MPVFYHTRRIPIIGDKVKLLDLGAFDTVHFISGLFMMLEKGENENISDVKVNDAIIGYDFIDNGNTMNSHGVIILESGNRLKFYIQDIDAMIKFCKKNNRDTRLNNIIDGTN